MGIFFTCPGTGFDPKRNYNFQCAVRGMTFGDVIPSVDHSIANVKFNSIYQLARLLAIYEHES
ncbi:unnamed protein product [Heligmosomoides polygyrus]|uniref:Uncharacterized protein n=1 Tax=Heligmosomoides polygyrus TaxID=6339 RepID=A0A3P8A4U3_HELPZ|nr:unnamed protein product [Heligmosomoides polygyrus]